MLDYITRRRMLMGSGASIDPTLENNDWEAISEIAKAGLAQKYWNIGDTKTFILDGQEHKAQIVAFDQYDVADSSAYGRNKAGIVFQTVNVTRTTVQMHDEKDTESGYAAMNGCSTIQSLVTNSEVGSLAVAVKIPYYGYGLRSVTLKGFVPSEYEVFGTKEYETTAVGTRYAFYANGGNAQKLEIGSTNRQWWLRSRQIGYTNTWVKATGNSSGGALTDYVTSSQRVAPCFCL